MLMFIEFTDLCVFDLLVMLYEKNHLTLNYYGNFIFYIKSFSVNLGFCLLSYSVVLNQYC